MLGPPQGPPVPITEYGHPSVGVFLGHTGWFDTPDSVGILPFGGEVSWMSTARI